MDIRPSEHGGAVLTSSKPVSVTIIYLGRRGYYGNGPKTRAKMAEFEQKALDGGLTRLSRVLNNPNGRPNFRALIRGLPVVRYTPWAFGERNGALFVTPGGSVVCVEAEVGRLPDSLHGQAHDAGLLTYQQLPTVERRLRELEQEVVAEMRAT